MSRLSMLAVAMIALASTEADTIRTPEEADRHDLDRSRKLREEIEAKRKQMNQEAYDAAAAPYREARRKRKAAMLERSKS